MGWNTLNTQARRTTQNLQETFVPVVRTVLQSSGLALPHVGDLRFGSLQSQWGRNPKNPNRFLKALRGEMRFSWEGGRPGSFSVLFSSFFLK